MRKMLWVGAGLLGLFLGAGAAEDKVPSIDDIMSKAHKAKTGLRDKVANEAKKASPDWTDIQKNSQEFEKLATLLGKNDPPKGDKASWKKLCDDYVGDVKDLNAAAKKKDKDGLIAANKKIGASCMECHDKHRE
jgi:cytochrome c556